jgi:alkylation response protein AidB-like acyl-CoA dehydrogenase
MDFSYHYTPEQQDFRRTVTQWLDRNVPENPDALYDTTEGAASLAKLSRMIWEMGWLAPSESAEDEGAALSADLTVVVLEELNRRGLLSLVQGEAQALRAALTSWGSEVQRDHLVRSLGRGERTVWRHQISLSSRFDSSIELDHDSVGLTATPDADGYIVNGSGMFRGFGNMPDILWTVALVHPDQSEPLPVCLLVDAAIEGITFTSPRTLSPMAARSVRFDDVWILRTDALGPEGDGHHVISAQVSLDPNADLTDWVETETDALLDYARETESGGKPLSADPIRARILVEAYIASRVSRLLRMRAAWERSREGESEKANALASLWRQAAASELSDTARQVVGPRALLSAADPQSADGGRFERLSRRELSERETGSSGVADREALALEIGMSGTKPES